MMKRIKILNKKIHYSGVLYYCRQRDKKVYVYRVNPDTLFCDEEKHELVCSGSEKECMAFVEGMHEMVDTIVREMLI